MLYNSNTLYACISALPSIAPHILSLMGGIASELHPHSRDLQVRYQSMAHRRECKIL